MNITNQNELEQFLKQTGWQSFEKLVANIFEEHGYKTQTNTVITGKEKTQVDVIAEGYGKKIVIECKKWKNNNSGMMLKEVKKQQTRKELLKANEAIIITLKEFKQKKVEEINIIPLNKLNNYLINE